MRTTLFMTMLTILPLNRLSECIELFAPPCTLEFVYGVNVDLTDANTGEPITGATLTLTEGTYSEVMQEISPGNYAGAGERPGAYTLTVQATGYQQQVITDIEVEAGRCHVVGEVLDVQLTPTP